LAKSLPSAPKIDHIPADHAHYDYRNNLMQLSDNNADAIAPGAVYLAPEGFEKDLHRELRLRGLDIVFSRERLMGTRQGPEPVAFAENIWRQPFLLPIRSIADGAKQLKAIQRNWALHSTCEHRRARLIEDALPPVSARLLEFGQNAPTSPLGAWTLWDRDHILASAMCSNPFVPDRPLFIEDRNGPPSRAYLKLWEAFTRLGRYPGPGDLCLDLGSSPGGWTWALARLGARVFSVDKAPLSPPVAANPLVEYCGGSAFALDPALVGTVDWLVCDVACYPEKLLALVQRWVERQNRTNFICTIKFAGETDFDSLFAFLRIPQSMAIHLYYNKHEITWILLSK
jgi:23S rRNA (cytidine2498-2'-O)-methyltransferase